MKPKIILHVGCEKTGSTSIQYALNASYDMLIERGILFPRSLGFPPNIHLTACTLHNSPNHLIRNLLCITSTTKFDNFVSDTLKNFSEEIKKNSPQKIILSDEHINGYLQNQSMLQEFKRICEMFGEIESVVIYLRRQDELRISAFSEAVKRGATQHFDIQQPLPVFQKIPYRLDYFKILENLSAVFGKDKIIPVAYNRENLINNDVVSDFLFRINVKDISLSEMGAFNENISIDATIIQHLARISRLLEMLPYSLASPIRSKIIKSCQKCFAGNKLNLEDSKHNKFMKQFVDINRKVKNTYFPSINQHEELFIDRKVKQRNREEYYPYCTVTWVQFIRKCFSAIKVD